MTTIVVVTKDDKAVIAADSQTSNGRIRAPTDMREYPKKIHKAGDAYVGLAGTSAHQNVFHSLIKHYEEKLDFSSADAIFETLRGAQTILEDEYYVLTKENDRNQEYASNQLSGLVASSSGIFEFHSYREVAQYNSFWAIGSGDEIALGALEVLYNMDLSAKEIAERAIKVASRFDGSTGLPVVSYEVCLT